VAGILHAMSDPARAAIVRELRREKKAMNCSATIGRINRSLPKSTCSQHFRILREAGLIFSEPKGAELVNRLRSEELEARFPKLLRSILDSYKKDRAG
jgi:DNA-binding transcriptional ArsR family regulator